MDIVSETDIMISKYRPLTLNDIIGQQIIVNRLKAYVKHKQIMHMLFSGPPGVGKTTCAQALCRELYGEEWKHYILELNASDERGIDTIRTKVQNFAKIINSSENISFKIIFLDEADALTRDAQQTLRRVMEDYSRDNRFILSCNYPHKIIPPIQDRCAIFRFSPIPTAELSVGIKYVAEKSGIKITDGAVKRIASFSNGSLRKSLNMLEDISIGHEKEISELDVHAVVGNYNKSDIGKLIEYSKDENWQEATNLYYKLKQVYRIQPLEIIHEMVEYIEKLPITTIPPEVKFKLYMLLGEVEWRISQGADDWIQFRWFLSSISMLKGGE